MGFMKTISVNDNTLKVATFLHLPILLRFLFDSTGLLGATENLTFDEVAGFRLNIFKQKGTSQSSIQQCFSKIN